MNKRRISGVLSRLGVASRLRMSGVVSDFFAPSFELKSNVNVLRSSLQFGSPSSFRGVVVDEELDWPVRDP